MPKKRRANVTLIIVILVVAAALDMLALKWSFWLMNQPSDIAVIVGLACVVLSLAGAAKLIIYVFTKGAKELAKLS